MATHLTHFGARALRRRAATFGAGGTSTIDSGLVEGAYAAVLQPDAGVAGDHNVFVRDLRTATTDYVSRATGISGAKGTDGPGTPSISGDGRCVAFQFAARRSLTPRPARP